MCNDPKCRFCNYEWTGRKLLVIACAGQSNSVGYAENFSYSVANTEGLYQLGLYGNNNLTVLPLSTTPENFQNLSNSTKDTKYPHAAAIKTNKTSYHLQLAFRLREAMEEEYDVLIVPVAYGGTRLSSTKNATFDDHLLTSKETMADYSWGAGKIFSQILIARILRAMSLHPDNIFGGIVWLQGEHDSTTQALADGHAALFKSLVEYVENGLADIKDKSIVLDEYGNKTVGKKAWFTPTTTEYWYISNKFETISNKSYADYLGLDNRILLPFDNQYTNANNGDGETSSVRNSHFRDMLTVGNGIANALLANEKIQFPNRDIAKYKNNSFSLSTFNGGSMPNSCYAITIDDLGDIYCNASTIANKQVLMWFDKEVKGFLLDNANTTNDIYLLIKNENEDVYALFISNTPNANKRYWTFYKTTFGNTNGSIYPITLAEVADSKDNNFKNLNSILRYSTGELANFPSKRGDVYGLSVNKHGNCLVINGYRSTNMIVRDDNQMILANDYAYVPIGITNVNMYDSTFYRPEELERIGNFIDKTTNKLVDLTIKPIQFGILTTAPIGTSTNAVKIGKFSNINKDPIAINYC